MNKEKKYHFIYKTTAKFNGKYYLGMHSTDDLNDGYLGSGKRLLQDVKKYGADQYEREIIEFCDTREELEKREKIIVNENTIDNWHCLNLILGGNDYKKGDKIYHTPFKNNKWIPLEYCYIIKENEIKHIITNLLPYYKSVGWEILVDEERLEKIRLENQPVYQDFYCNIIKDGETQEIIKNTLPFYLRQGWIECE